MPTPPRPAIDFYFDFSSPYGYFMSERLDALAAQHGRSVTWRPVLLFALLRALEMPAPLAHPVKRAYTLADFERSARYLGIDYRLPASFPAVTQHAARAFYLLQQEAPLAAVPFAHEALRGYWRDGIEIAQLEHIATLASAAARDRGVDVGTATQLAERLQGDAAKALLQQAITAAAERHVFGSPFVIVDGEAFFGVDRLPQIAAKLAAV